MNLIDVDVIGSKPAQGVLDLPLDAGTAGIAGYFSILLLKPGLGGNKHLRAQFPFDRLADDLLGAAKSIDRCDVTNIVPMLERGPDGGDGFGFVGATPNPPPIAQVPIATGDTLSGVPGMLVSSVF